MKTEQWLKRIAHRPNGLIVRHDQTHLKDASNAMRMLVKHGEIRQLVRGVYIQTHHFAAASDWEIYALRAYAHGLTKGRTMAGYSAVAIYGLWRYQAVPTRHFLYRRSHGRKLASSATVRELNNVLAAEDHNKWEGVPVTSLWRTIVDLVKLNGYGAGFVTLCHAMRLEATSQEDMAQYIATRYDTALMRTMIKGASPLVESALEAKFLAQVTFYQGFEVTPQVEIGTFRVDFQVKGTKHVIELDGFEKYGQEQGEQSFNLRKEKRRAEAIRQAGYHYHAFTYREVDSLEAYTSMLKRLELSIPPSFPPLHWD